MSLNNIIGLQKDELVEKIKSIGESAFRAHQLWNWVYRNGVRSFEDMTNFKPELKEKLSQNFSLDRNKIIETHTSSDGTIKWLIELSSPNKRIEAVFIPESDRGTLCVSSQVGCAVGCSFCYTGTQKMLHNLTAQEIVMQLIIARDQLNQWPADMPPKIKPNKITNIVFMGMGEPLLNYNNVIKSIKIMMNDEGLAIGKRRITVSTSGIIKNIHRCAMDTGVRLAVSLHAPYDNLRNSLVPINKQYPIKDLMVACRDYAHTTKKRITFEYTMLKGVNDSLAQASDLARLTQNVPCKFNLIPFNSWPGNVYESSAMSHIAKFGDILKDYGHIVLTRTPRGRDIQAACGQLIDH